MYVELSSFRVNAQNIKRKWTLEGLKEGTKMDIVVPDHLSSLKSKIDRLAFKIRKKAAENGKKVSTSLRLDDSTESLVAAVKDGKEGQWLYYSVNELEELEASLNNPGSEEDDEV